MFDWEQDATVPWPLSFISNDEYIASICQSNYFLSFFYIVNTFIPNGGRSYNTNPVI